MKSFCEPNSAARILLCWVVSLITWVVQAQDFPSKQITIIVGLSPGGGTDIFARLFAQKLAPALNTNVIVDNRPGAAGTLATSIVARAAPNGQTLLYTPANLTSTQAVNRNLQFDVRKDLAAVIKASRSAYVLTIHPSLPARNVKEFLALAKSRPGALDYGSSGAGSPSHLAAELLKYRSGIDIQHIPYKGAATIITALLSGEVQTSFIIPLLAKQYMQSGRLRGIAVSAMQRAVAVPDLPTLHESGVRDFEITQWHGFLAPGKTPVAIINRVHNEVSKALSSPDVINRLSTEGMEPVGGSPSDFSAFLVEDIRRLSDLAQRIGLKGE